MLRAVNPALETLLLAFSPEGLPIPGRALFLGAEPHPAFREWPEITGWQPFKPKADAWENAGFTRSDEPGGKWPVVLVLPGKSRDETFAWFALARELLEPGGRVVAAMPNTAGAARFEKELGKAAGNIASIQKHKCRAFHATLDDADGKIFAEWAALGRPRLLPDTPYRVEAGVFSADHVDPGSALLAEHLPAHLRGRAADLGAGWGYLSDRLLERCPRVGRVDLFEADARALACARQNLARHSRETHFHWHDVTTGLPDRYDVIVSNPPFHTGQATDMDLGRAFLTVAAGALERGGQLLLVANRQLPYEAVLRDSGLVWRKTAENATFKLLSAEKR